MDTHMGIEHGANMKSITGSKQRAERGIALLMTIFGLLLLTGITLAMLYSSDSETMIAVNYRDKEVATYAALSALQEARDRIQPKTGDLAMAGYIPTKLPTATNLGQVFYIINPRNGESVTPWDNTNPYFDTELCQEKYMSSSTTLNTTAGTVGKACTTSGIPATCTLVGTAPTGWCSYYDNSANATGWKLKDTSGNATPLDYKWVRITLKADNMAPVYVQSSGAAANYQQVCWDNNPDQQVPLPLSAGTDCLGGNTYSVGGFNLNSGGSGYSSSTPPTVTISGGGGSGATAVAVLANSGGGITSAAVTNTTTVYASKPTVTISNPDGTGAAFSAVLSGSPVTSLAPSGTNYCYALGTSGLGVSLNPSPPPTAGGSAAATVSMTTQACVSHATATASCGNGKKNATLNLSDSGGFAGTITLNNAGKITGGAVNITSVGNYASVPNLSQTVQGCAITVTAAGGLRINSISLTNGGEYIAKPTAAISGTAPSAPNSTQPTLTVGWTAGANNGKVGSITVSSSGTGYVNMAVNHYTLVDGSGTVLGAATSSGVATYVSGLSLTSGGSGYLSAPTVTISGPGGGATATAALAYPQQLELGRVYMLTSMAMTRNNTKSMAQMEVGVTPPWKFQLGGALTLAGKDESFGTPNSNVFMVNGNDHAGTGTEPAGCNNTPGVAMPAIGVADAVSQSCVIYGTQPDGSACPNSNTGLGKPNNYTGIQASPDVQVVPAADPSASDLQGIVQDIQTQAGTVNVPGPATLSSVSNWGSPTNLQTIVVNGDLTLAGNPSGYGVLVVTGNLTLKGDFTWHGVVLVIGNADSVNNGGGNGQITGAMYVGNSLGGHSTFDWTGGGGNGINYDHCWADDLLNHYPAVTSGNPLQVLSSRLLNF
jgi:Tfp pilus assembly protein PilX